MWYVHIRKICYKVKIIIIADYFHFVQVFAYKQGEFKTVQDIYKKKPELLKGFGAQFFSQYTVKANEYGYGHVDNIGKICIASYDSALAKTIEDKKWFDSKYAQANSIFSPFLRPDSVNPNKAFINNTVTGIELASLSKFAEYYRMLAWEQIMKGAMYSCFSNGTGVCPYFNNSCPYNLKKVYSSSDILCGDGLLSTLATPTVNVFKERIDLNSVDLLFPDIVKEFNTFSSALEISLPSSNKSSNGVIEIPGSESVSLVSHVVSVEGKVPIPPVLCVSDKAYSTIKSKLYCGEFYGGFLIKNNKGTESFVVMNGLLFQSKAGSSNVTVYDIRQSPSEKFVALNLINFHLSLMEAEFRLSFVLYTDSEENKTLICRYLLWLGGAVGQASVENFEVPADSKALQARALYLAKIVANSKAVGVQVPYITYSAYKDAVDSIQKVIQTANLQLTSYQSQIRDRKAEERAIKRQEQLNENIIKTGHLISDYISAQAQFEESMGNHYDSVIQTTEKEIIFLTKQESTLQEKINRQRVIVRDEVEKYKDAVADWQKNQTISAALDIASNIFALGFAIVIPSTAVEALKNLGELVGRIQKVFKVFEAIIKVYKSYKSLPKDPSRVIDVLSDVPLKGLDLLSSLEWGEMKVKMSDTLNSGPDIGAKKHLAAAFDILVLRGQALVEVQNVMQAKLSNLTSTYSNKRMHDDQKKRLDEIKVHFNTKPQDLNKSKVDLIGLSSKLVLFQRQMLATMASTLEIQGRALQYENLQPPTSVPSFSFLDLQFGILSQAQSILQGLTVQPIPQSQPEPVVYEIHGVFPENLTNGNMYTFKIPVNKREFASYNYVRVDKIEAEVGGIKSTNSGKYYAELNFYGDPFMDRGFNGEVITFQTEPRLYTYKYNVSSSRHCKDLLQTVDKSHECLKAEVNQLQQLGISADDHFGDKVSKITPFSTWSISLPPTSSNENIVFDDCTRGVTIRLTFYLFAQLKEKESLTLSERMHRATVLRTRNIEITPDMLLSDSFSKALVQKSPNVSTSDVLETMASKSVVYGCDVVFSLSSTQVNDNLMNQYKDRQNNKDFLRDTDGEVTIESTSSIGKKSRTKFDFQFNAPKLQFILNNSAYATVMLPILSGHYEYDMYVDDKWTAWEKADVKQSDNYYIQGEVPLGYVQGEVSTKMDIALKLKGGKFSSQHFKPGTSNPSMNDALNKYFTEKLPKYYQLYKLGTLDTKNITLLPSMTPSKFQLNVYHTEKSNRDVLQLFIATTSELACEPALQISEPFPSKYECSLIISSKIFFGDVMNASFENTNGLKIEGFKPSINLGQWSGKAKAGSICGHYPETKVGSYIDSVGIVEAYIAVPNNTATVSLEGMMFECNGSNWGAKMSFEMKDKDYTFKYGTRYSWSPIDYKNYSVQVTVTMSANLDFTVSGKGQDQKLQLATVSSTNPDMKGNLEPPGGACKCNDRELQQSFVKNLNSALTENLKVALKHNFPSVSLFALKNILFPAKNIIDLKEVYVPGDATVFGSFTTYA